MALQKSFVKIYVFGNEDTELDNKPFVLIDRLRVEKNLQDTINKVEFIKVGLNKDLPFDNGENVILIDTVAGLPEITELTERDLDSISVSNSTSVHDFDLAFQLKYLKKLGKLGTVKIIGIPQDKDISNDDYLRIQLIFKKLVAHDIQGS